MGPRNTRRSESQEHATIEEGRGQGEGGASSPLDTKSAAVRSLAGGDRSLVSRLVAITAGVEKGEGGADQWGKGGKKNPWRRASCVGDAAGRWAIQGASGAIVIR